MRDLLAATTIEGTKVLIHIDEAAKLFSTCVNKQNCFKDFMKTNQLNWFKNNVTENLLHKVNCKRV